MNNFIDSKANYQILFTIYFTVQSKHYLQFLSN